MSEITTGNARTTTLGPTVWRIEVRDQPKPALVAECQFRLYA